VPIWGHGGAYTYKPFQGRSIVGSPTTFGFRSSTNQSLFGDATNFAHELGHFFGLSHTFDDNNESGFILASYMRNPWTGQPWKYSEFWDLVYRPGISPYLMENQFFSSQSAAQVYESSLFSINTYRADPV
jgi:hypothetical protein